MLRKTFTLLVATVLMIASAQAKIWRVNNNPGIKADAQKAQEAYQLSNAGDTIQFEPSPNGYGDLTISQKVILIGTGAYFNDTVPNTQYSTLNPYLGKITISAGGDNSVIMVNCQGITMTGVNGVTVQRCYIWTNSFNVSNCLDFAIRGIYLDGRELNVQNGSSGIITNSILIKTNTCSTNGISIDNTCRNIKLYSNTIEADRADISNSDISQNIFYQVYGSGSCCCTGDAVFILNGCNVNYNVFTSGIKFQGNTPVNVSQNNKVDVAANTVFALTGNYGSYFKLITGSNATKVGTAKLTCGAYDGTIFQFRTDVQPPVPAIYNLSVPAQAGNSLKFSVSTKSNN